MTISLNKIKNILQDKPFIGAVVAPLAIALMASFVLALVSKSIGYLASFVYYFGLLAFFYALPTLFFAWLYTRRNKKTSILRSPVWLPGVTINNFYLIGLLLFMVAVQIMSRSEPDAGFLLIVFVPISWVAITVVNIASVIGIYALSRSNKSSKKSKISPPLIIAICIIVVVAAPYIYTSVYGFLHRLPSLSEKQTLEYIEKGYICDGSSSDDGKTLHVVVDMRDSKQINSVNGLEAVNSKDSMIKVYRVRTKNNNTIRNALGPKLIGCDKAKLDQDGSTITTISKEEYVKGIKECRYFGYPLSPFRYGKPADLMFDMNTRSYNAYIKSFTDQGKVVLLKEKDQQFPQEYIDEDEMTASSTFLNSLSTSCKENKQGVYNR